MRENAEKSIDHVLQQEGGYVDHPRDPGGCTNRGITRATLRQWRRRRVTCGDVRLLTREEAEQIYRSLYWDQVKGDGLPAGIDLHVFDMGVNAGPRMAAKLLQRIVGVDDDGIIGPVTLSAAHRVAAVSPEDLVDAYADARMAYYRSLPHWRTFGRGWSSRCKAATAAAKRLIAAGEDQEGNRQKQIDYNSLTLAALIVRVARIEEAIGLEETNRDTGVESEDTTAGENVGRHLA